MTASWNGLPDQPEQSGWHVIACGAPRAVWWDAESHYWWDRERRFYITIPEIKASSRSYKYLGAVYSSSELAQMRKGERERDDRILLPTYDAFCNDAKGLMSGEFHFQGDEEECQECGGTGIEDEDDEGEYECMRCDGTGVRRENITVPWTTIKEIYRAIVDEYGPCALTDDEGKKS